MPLTILQYIFRFPNLGPSMANLPRSHDRVEALARGLANGLVLEQAARDANLSLATAHAIYSSDAFKNLLAEHHAKFLSGHIGIPVGTIR